MHSKIPAVVVAVARCIFGLFYAAIGALGTYGMLADPNGEWPNAYNDAEKALTSALTAAGFFVPTVSLTSLVGGLATVYRRTAPLGLLILTPLIVMIFLYHAFLTGAYLHAGVQVIYLAVLYWFHRDAFVPLWNYGRAGAA